MPQLAGRGACVAVDSELRVSFPAAAQCPQIQLISLPYVHTGVDVEPEMGSQWQQQDLRVVGCVVQSGAQNMIAADRSIGMQTAGRRCSAGPLLPGVRAPAARGGQGQWAGPLCVICHCTALLNQPVEAALLPGSLWQPPFQHI